MANLPELKAWLTEVSKDAGVWIERMEVEDHHIIGGKPTPLFMVHVRIRCKTGFATGNVWMSIPEVEADTAAVVLRNRWRGMMTEVWQSMTAPEKKS